MGLGPMSRSNIERYWRSGTPACELSAYPIQQDCLFCIILPKADLFRKHPLSLLNVILEPIFQSSRRSQTD
jgi:hypothetical protein